MAAGAVAMKTISTAQGTCSDGDYQYKVHVVMETISVTHGDSMNRRDEDISVTHGGSRSCSDEDYQYSTRYM